MPVIEESEQKKKILQNGEKEDLDVGRKCKVSGLFEKKTHLKKTYTAVISSTCRK